MLDITRVPDSFLEEQDELIPEDILFMYKSVAVDVLEDSLEEYFENEGIDVDKVNIIIKIETEITFKDSLKAV